NRRGIALGVGGQIVSMRARFGSIAESDAPIQLGLGPDGAEPFTGEIGDLVFFPVALDAADLPLRGVGHLTVEDGLTASATLDGAEPQLLQARVPVRAPGADGHPPFQIRVECLRRGRADWHPRSTRAEARLADADGLIHTVRHLCPAGSDAVRLAVDGQGGADLEIGAVDLGRLGAAALDLGLEPEDVDLPYLRGFGRSDVAKTGSSSLRLPPGSTPSVTLPVDGAEGLDISAWARTERAGDTASLQLEVRCLDGDGEALETPTGSAPERRRATTTPGRVDGDWRRYQLLYSCPRDPGGGPASRSVEISLLGTGAGAILLDDLTVVVP
ncbi:MAG: hypothetical protein AAFX50_21505, partial [Acidobacteriota bacterium]